MFGFRQHYATQLNWTVNKRCPVTRKGINSRGKQTLPVAYYADNVRLGLGLRGLQVLLSG